MVEMAAEPSFRPIVGIDLGTTNSTVAYIRDGSPQVVLSPAGQALVPSVVLIDPQGRVIVGQDARDGLVAMPERSIAAVKRLMGSSETISLANQNFLPEEISAIILKEIRRHLTPLYEDNLVEAVITVPAYFNDAQRRATKRAGELAGFVVERIINEPTAAALAYGLRNLRTRQNVLVYDLGGGTFDVSVVALDDGILEVIASNGNRHLGGEDFDWRLVDILAERVENTHGVDPRNDLRARAVLKDLAEHVKWTLSDEEAAAVDSPVLMVANGTPLTIKTVVTRQEFVDLIQPWLDETFALVTDVLAQAGLASDAIDQVLLVGGSTRIPRLREMIADYFGRPARTDVDPDLVVALGAAVQAGLKSGALSDSGLVATDVAPFSMGLAVAKPDWTGAWQAGWFEPIIPRNTAIPCSRTKAVSTLVDGQTAIAVELFQGEHKLVANNHGLGSFLLEGIPSAPAGSEQIMVTFRYNLNGILEASAEIVSTQKSQTVVVQDGLDRQSPEALETTKTRLEALWTGPPAAADGEEAPDGVLPVLGPDETDDMPVEDDQQIREQAQRAIADLKALISQWRGTERRQAQTLLEQLQSALLTQDPQQLREALDQAIDRLFEWV